MMDSNSSMYLNGMHRSATMGLTRNWGNRIGQDCHAQTKGQGSGNQKGSLCDVTSSIEGINGL